jgi:hypothetical protein
MYDTDSLAEAHQGTILTGNSLRYAGILAVALPLAGCGGSGGGSSSTPSTPSASAGGFWRGSDSISGLPIVGLIDEVGEFHFLRSDGAQYVGTANVSGNSISANIEGFVPIGYQFPDGSTRGTGSVSGNLEARTAINLNTQFRTDAGSVSNGTLDLTFDAIYNRVSSLATIAGTYTNPQDGSVITVGSDGTVFSQDPTTGCVLNGTVSIINASYNAYRLQFSDSSCIGQASVLNGVQFSGLAALDNTVTPETAVVGVTGQAGGSKYAEVLTLPRS